MLVVEDRVLVKARTATSSASPELMPGRLEGIVLLVVLTLSRCSGNPISFANAVHTDSDRSELRQSQGIYVKSHQQKITGVRLKVVKKRRCERIYSGI